MKKLVKLVKNKSELGAGSRGSSLSIDAIEVAAVNQGDHFFNEISTTEIYNSNKAIYKNTLTPHAKYISSIIRVLDNLSNTVSNILSDEDIPLIISGDHSSSYGTICGLKFAFPTKKVGILWIDAHADIHSPYTSPSGNMHGMPLAAALGLSHKNKAINKVNSDTNSNWDHLLSLGNSNPKINPEDIVYIGVRDIEPIENTIIKELGIKRISVKEVRTKGVDYAVSEALKQINGCDVIYTSFDIDSLDPDKYSYGTGTPVKNGLFLEEVTSFIEKFNSKKQINCFELVEVNPTLDNKKNTMAEAGFKVIKHFYNLFN